ncbi:MAG: hypothetical protein IJU58_00040 [Clostridia bacterium]|nr:hypothetical protein [Clostridia bacterium]
MAEDKQEDVIDMDAKEAAPKEEAKQEEKNAEVKQTEAKKPAIQVNVPLNILVVVCAIATIVVAFLTQFFLVVGCGFTFITICRCFKYILACATVVMYVFDYLKNKNFAVNPSFICVLLAIFVATFVG